MSYAVTLKTLPSIRRVLPQFPLLEMAIGLALLVSASLSIVFTRVPDGIALFWPSSAIAGALLIRLPTARWSAALSSAASALMLANIFVAHRPWGPAALFSGVNIVEITLVLAFLATLMPPIAVGLGSDARRAAARALRVSERRFRESMEHSPIGMLISDLNGVWGYTNFALQEMLGYSAEEFRAMPPGGPSKTED